MSHAAALLAILNREAERRTRRIVKYAALHAAIARARVTERRSAALIERAEELRERLR